MVVFAACQGDAVLDESISSEEDLITESTVPSNTLIEKLQAYNDSLLAATPSVCSNATRGIQIAGADVKGVLTGIKLGIRIGDLPSAGRFAPVASGGGVGEVALGLHGGGLRLLLKGKRIPFRDDAPRHVGEEERRHGGGLGVIVRR